MCVNVHFYTLSIVFDQPYRKYTCDFRTLVNLNHRIHYLEI